MVVLGIDPGLETCGWGIVRGDGNRLQPVDYGLVTTERGTPPEMRLMRLHEGLCAVMEGHGLDLVAVERLYFSRNVGSAIAVGEARGIALLAAAQRGIRVAEYTPPEVKQAVSGYGGAPKEQVLRMVRTLLGLGEQRMRDDAADALAIALCGYFRAAWEARAL